MRRLLASLILILFAFPAASSAAEEADVLIANALILFEDDGPEKRSAINFFVNRGRGDAAPALILALRFHSGDDAFLVAALEKLTGARAGKAWSDWMLWQEKTPEAGTMPGFDRLLSKVYVEIDENFLKFLPPAGVAKHEIRLEEIAWGGVVKDGIPDLTNPKLIPASSASYLKPDDLTFGVSINGDARAYPLRILDWHEMLNDVIGGVPVSLAYCTLCGSGVLFETTVAGFPQPVTFGTSGFLYRSNKLMYDKTTHSLWNQFTGRPVVGPLTGSGLTLKTRPVVITRWADWKARNPNTRVLDQATGYARDYAPGRPYGPYFASPDLMFPTNVDQSRLKQKDYVFALRSSGAEKAWPMTLFEGGAVINDRAGIVDLTIVGDAASRTARAYRSDGLTFVKGAKPDEVKEGQTTWTVTEEALVGPEGRTLPRLPGHIAYWFAWSGYFGGQGELAK